MSIKAFLISPGFKVPVSDVEKTIDYWRDQNPSVSLLNSKRHLIDTNSDLLSSGTSEERIEELEQAFTNKETDLIWALRGGYGSQELVPAFSAMKISSKKIFLGFSDCTSLHYILNKKFKMASVHSPHPNTFFKGLHGESVCHRLKEILGGDRQQTRFDNLKIINGPFDCSEVRAPILGGNLTTVVSLIGTPEFQGFKDDMLFLEEIDEPAYKVRRHFEHLHQSKALEGVKGLLLGHFTHQSANQEKLIFKVIQEFSQKIEVPVVWGVQAGHSHEFNHPFWLGKKTHLLLDEKPRLIHNNKGE